MQKYGNLGINLQFKKEKLNGFSMIRTAVQKPPKQGGKLNVV